MNARQAATSRDAAAQEGHGHCLSCTWVEAETVGFGQLQLAPSENQKGVAGSAEPLMSFDAKRWRRCSLPRYASPPATSSLESSGT